MSGVHLRRRVTKNGEIHRGIKGRLTTHCPRGHEYTPENTRLQRGMRGCKRCHAIRERARRARLRVALRGPGADTNEPIA